MKSPHRRDIGGGDRLAVPESLDHKIDGAVLQMQPAAIGEERDLRLSHPPFLHAGNPRGQGLSGRGATSRWPSSISEDSGRTSLMWPPSAA